MKTTLNLIIIALFMMNCSANREANCEKNRKYNSVKIKSTENLMSDFGSVSGKIIEESGEAIIGATVSLKETNIGDGSNIEGEFELENIPAGTYTLKISAIGYTNLEVEGFEIKSGELIKLEPIILRSEDVLLKPIIYCYPVDTVDLSVHLNYDGALTHTYPESPQGKWNVRAYPDGTLVDKDGRTYYSLYWEGVTEHQKSIETGFVVKREETISFLEEKLALLGLNEREANEFIIFWLPILNQNACNLIHFDTDFYTSYAELNILPKPETMIRILMLHCPISADFSIAAQKIDSTPIRKGFTVVEWGGRKLNESQFSL